MAVVQRACSVDLWEITEICNSLGYRTFSMYEVVRSYRSKHPLKKDHEISHQIDLLYSSITEKHRYPGTETWYWYTKAEHQEARDAVDAEFVVELRKLAQKYKTV